jgi:uncharacterized protein YdeI (BOF family)
MKASLIASVVALSVVTTPAFAAAAPAKSNATVTQEKKGKVHGAKVTTASVKKSKSSMSK